MRPTAAQHPSDADLAAFALGQMDQTAAEWISHHLEDCSTCRTVVETTPGDNLVNRLRAANAGPATVSTATASWDRGADTQGEVPTGSPMAVTPELPPALRDHPKYRILGPLGRGGMGMVFRAEHRMMERLVAVKIVHAALVDNPDAAERFQREIRAAARLDHPNIVKAYDAEKAGGLQLLAMEYVEGQSLADYVKRKGPLPVAHACHYIRQAALGLQHAHEQGLVHRDLKPHNLIRTPKGVVKILDFGLAKLVSERRTEEGLTGENALMGTAEYIAPEQAQDTKSADIRADIYSLGCTLFYLLAGRPPFTGSDWLAIVIAHVQDTPPALETLRPEAPAELAALVARMLAKDPAQRPQTPMAVADALAPFVKPAKMPAPEPAETLATAAGPGAGRRRRLGPRSILVGLVLIAGIGAAIWAKVGWHPEAASNDWASDADDWAAQGPPTPDVAAPKASTSAPPLTPREEAVVFLRNAKEELLRPRFDAQGYRQTKGKTVPKDKAEKIARKLEDNDRKRTVARGKLDKAISAIEQNKPVAVAELLNPVRETIKELRKNSNNPNIQRYMDNAEWNLDAAITKLRKAQLLSK